ncbi:unnamed protein product [Toxocara canis]|uniref:DUF295 domain-containing protein n=1 Tax=Toxocara canis TaxID=6265 RepID=A0A183VBL1_TOXCA|nr:unnamed protein product [Toxocara canis]
MAFCAPPKPNCGFLEHGCALYGGLQIRPNVPTSATAADFYIPQFNLAAHWQKPFLVPHSIGFLSVLTRPLDWSSPNDVPCRPPGQWYFDTPACVLKNRNLLTGLLDEDVEDDVIRLWAVNELSSRESLMEFRVKRKEEEDGLGRDWELVGGSEEETRVEGEAGIDDSMICERSGKDWKRDVTALTSRGSQRLLSTQFGSSLDDHPLTTCRNGADRFGAERASTSNCHSGPVACLNLPSPALQLLAWPSAGRNAYVLIRTEKSLCLYNSEKKEINTLYSSRMQYVTPMPYMDEELLMMDQEKLVWYGGVEQGSARLARVKCVGNIQLVCPSDHPRIIYVADAESVWMVDLRDGTSHGSILYSVPEFDDTRDCGLLYSYHDAFPKPKVQHICAFNRRPRMLLVVTSNKFNLIDERMPGVCCIEQSHSIADGGDYILSAPSFTDSEHDGHIYPFYVIRNVTLADVQQISFYDHAQAKQWSSLSHVKRLPEPADIARFLDEQRKYGIRISKGQQRRLFGDGPTRAIHVQDGLKSRDSRERHILFRMVSDGSIWYEETGVEDDREIEEEALSKSVEKVRRMVNEIGDVRLVSSL